MKRTKKKFKFTVIATDVVIFTILNEKLQVLLMRMKKDPYLGSWAAPGGLVDPKESVDASAKRHLIERTGLKNVYLEQLYTFGEVNRDPFGRVVSVAYFALVPLGKLNLKKITKSHEVKLYPVNDLPKLAYDHREMIETAVERLKAKLGYTNIVYSLLPREFTLGKMQKVYEIILGRELDKRNFRKKIFSLGLVKKTGKREVDVPHRPAELYAFSKRNLQIIEIL